MKKTILTITIAAVAALTACNPFNPWGSVPISKIKEEKQAAMIQITKLSSMTGDERSKYDRGIEFWEGYLLATEVLLKE